MAVSATFNNILLTSHETCENEMTGWRQPSPTKSLILGHSRQGSCA